MKFVIKSFRQLRKIIIGFIGFTVLLIGVILIFLPGPGLLVIPAGLAILSTEFLWARNLLKKIKKIRFRKKSEEVPDQKRKAA